MTQKEVFIVSNSKYFYNYWFTLKPIRIYCWLSWDVWKP